MLKIKVDLYLFTMPAPMDTTRSVFLTTLPRVCAVLYRIPDGVLLSFYPRSLKVSIPKLYYYNWRSLVVRDFLNKCTCKK